MGCLIYLVGGAYLNDHKLVMSKKTEKYYVDDNEWDLLMPELNTGKQGVALCKF